MIKKQDTIFPQPFYYIGFSIVNENESESQFQSLFSNEKNSFKHFLEKGVLGRFGGWNIPKDVQYLIQIDGLEHIDTVRRVKVFENGHIIVQGAVSEDFLCWANSNSKSDLKGERIQINTTALIEFTYNCVVLLKRALEDADNSKKIICEFGFLGMGDNFVLGDVKLPSQSHLNHSWVLNPIGSITESKMNIEIDDLSNDGVAKVSYSILTIVFRMFGFSEDIISYAHSDGKKIDIELMKNIG